MRTQLVKSARTWVNGDRWSAHKRLGTVFLVLAFAGAYALSIALYARSGAVHRIRAERPPTISKTTVTVDVKNIESNYSVLDANIAVSPGPALLDPVTHGLKEDLSVAVTSVATPTKRTWSKGMLPGIFPVPLTLAGEVEHWPFDRYHTGPITVELFIGATPVPERATVTFVDRLPGWKVDVTVPGQGDWFAPYEVRLRRSLGTATFAIVILAVLVAIAGQALFVALQTLRDQRKFEAPMTAWYAAMLFAVVPLRNALPGSPPFGIWIDITIVLWVIVVLVISMLLYIASWWRHMKPDQTVDLP
jgi:Domain of unknown function (DUF4436)